MFLETKITKYVLQLYIYTTAFYAFHNAFKVCSKSVSEVWYICPVIVVGTVITMGQNIYQQQLVNWKCIVDTADIWKTLDVFYIYFFNHWFVEIKLKKLSILTCEFVSNLIARYWYKMVATPCSRHSLWLCIGMLLVSTNIDHFFLTYNEKCDGRNFSYT